MKNDLFKEIKKAHFIGIGGIGVSALARMMILLGKEVTGSDQAANLATQKIEQAGGRVFIGHGSGNLLENVDIVIYSPAIPQNNSELIKAKKIDIPCYSYPQALGLISKNRYTLAVAGTHGKTTTTAMLADILIQAEKDPTVVVGSFLSQQRENFILGQSSYFIVEACEYKKSFLKLKPDILIITNIDADHLDYYGSLKKIIRSFAKLIKKVPEDGYIIVDMSDSNIQKALDLVKPKAKAIDYSRQNLEVELKVPGEHNKLNAQAALAAAQVLEINQKYINQALQDFSGTWRRFEYKGETGQGALVYDDYAHHPTEIRATLAAVREKFPSKKIIVVFQPHLYSRTKFLLDDFAQSFNQADKIIVADIYAAREKFDETIHSQDLVKKIGDKANYISDFERIAEQINKCADKNALVIILGAGDIFKIAKKLVD